MVRSGLVVIDPVRAFTDPKGVVSRVHPPEQFAVIRETVARLASFSSSHAGPKVWVSAHYTPGQFTGGDLSHPLANLCADGESADCEWDRDLVPPEDAIVVTKTTMDACSSPAFVDAVESIIGEADALLITGFWLTACVAATATSCADRFGARIPVVVPLSLAATRTGLYGAGVDACLDQLRRAGVMVCETPEDCSVAGPC